MSNLTQFGFPILVYISCLAILRTFVQLEVKKTPSVLMSKALLYVLLIAVVVMMFMKIGSESLLAFVVTCCAIASILSIDRDFTQPRADDHSIMSVIFALLFMAALTLMAFMK